MTAGGAQLAFGKETAFKGPLVDDGSGNTLYWKFGLNPSITEGPTLERVLERMREADSVEATHSVAGDIEGAFGVEATVSADVHSDVEDLVFNDGGTGFVAQQPAASGRIFTGINDTTGEAERELVGAAPQDYTVTYDREANTVTYQLVFTYATENYGTTISPSTITRATEGSAVPFHGFDLTLDGTSVGRLQSCELSISDIARLKREADPEAVKAVIANPQTSLSADALWTGPDLLELAYGADNATEPQDNLVSVPGQVSLTDVGGSTVTTYDLPKVKIGSSTWADIVAPADSREQIDANVDGGVTVV